MAIWGLKKRKQELILRNKWLEQNMPDDFNLFAKRVFLKEIKRNKNKISGLNKRIKG